LHLAAHDKQEMPGPVGQDASAVGGAPCDAACCEAPGSISFQ